MVFANRTEAGQALAARLRKYANRDDLIVLGAPRGGVPVAFEVAQGLMAPLDVFVLRKLGVPGREELAFGAIACGGYFVTQPCHASRCKCLQHGLFAANKSYAILSLTDFCHANCTHSTSSFPKPPSKLTR
jgi:predicted phosphoribosyltransferase